MEAALKELGPKTARIGGGRAVRAGIRVAVREAKRLVPVRTGRLRRSIVGRMSKRARQNERVAVLGFRQPTSSRAHFTEFGTAHSSARPFVRPALDSQAGKMLEAMGEELALYIAREEFKRAVFEGAIDIEDII